MIRYHKEVQTNHLIEILDRKSVMVKPPSLFGDIQFNKSKLVLLKKDVNKYQLYFTSRPIYYPNFLLLNFSVLQKESTCEIRGTLRMKAFPLFVIALATALMLIKLVYVYVEGNASSEVFKTANFLAFVIFILSVDSFIFIRKVNNFFDSLITKEFD